MATLLALVLGVVLSTPAPLVSAHRSNSTPEKPRQLTAVEAYEEWAQFMHARANGEVREHYFISANAQVKDDGTVQLNLGVGGTLDGFGIKFQQLNVDLEKERTGVKAREAVGVSSTLTNKAKGDGISLAAAPVVTLNVEKDANAIDVMFYPAPAHGHYLTITLLLEREPQQAYLGVVRERPATVQQVAYGGAQTNNSCLSAGGSCGGCSPISSKCCRCISSHLNCPQCTITCPDGECSAGSCSTL